MTHNRKHARHFEVGDFVIFDHEAIATPTDADIREVIGYQPDGLALMIYPTGLRGIFKARKDALEETGCQPRRCTLAGMTVWQGVYAERCNDLTGIDELDMKAPANNPLLHFEPRNAREKEENA